MFCHENLVLAEDHVDYSAVTSRLRCCHGSHQFVCDKLSASFDGLSEDWWEKNRHRKSPFR